MKTKHSIINALLAGTLLVMSGAASAAVVWSWTGTVAQWANPIAPPNGGGGGNAGLIYDGYNYDNGATAATAPNGGNAGVGVPFDPALQDTVFTFVSNTMNATNVSITETHNAGVDLYNVNIDGLGNGTVGNLLTVGGQFIYQMDTTDPLGFTMAAIDSIVLGSIGVVNKSIYTDQTMSTLLWSYNSVNGARIPSVGWIDFNPYATYTSLYIVDTIVSGQVTNVFNEIAVPEPASLALFGLGLLGLLGFSRKSGSSSGMKYC